MRVASKMPAFSTSGPIRHAAGGLHASRKGTSRSSLLRMGSRSRVSVVVTAAARGMRVLSFDAGEARGVAKYPGARRHGREFALGRRAHAGPSRLLAVEDAHAANEQVEQEQGDRDTDEP